MFEIDLLHDIQHLHLHAGEMELSDRFDAGIYPLIHITLDWQNLTLVGSEFTILFPFLTTINLTARKWTRHATKSIN